MGQLCALPATVMLPPPDASLLLPPLPVPSLGPCPVPPLLSTRSSPSPGSHVQQAAAVVPLSDGRGRCHLGQPHPSLLGLSPGRV